MNLSLHEIYLQDTENDLLAYRYDLRIGVHGTTLAQRWLSREKWILVEAKAVTRLAEWVSVFGFESDYLEQLAGEFKLGCVLGLLLSNSSSICNLDAGEDGHSCPPASWLPAFGLGCSSYAARN